MKVLDKGFVEVIDTLGTDLTVVNAARVSFGKRKYEWDNSDEKLVRYLVRNKHFSPFRHPHIQFHIKAPEFVIRQIFRHVVGIEATSNHVTKDSAFNEISGRYTEVTEFYVPDKWRLQSKNNKQGSDFENELGWIQQQSSKHDYDEILEEITMFYSRLLERGVAKEQARILLPLSQYTEWYWTSSLQALFNFIELRDDDHAQWEIREYAKVMKECVEVKFPMITKIWFEERNI